MAERFVALLRAVNVGGTGKLEMAELRRMCEAAGFTDVRTYIASGNVVFGAAMSEAEVKATLEAALADYAGKPVGVMVRTAAEMAAVRDGNPFADFEGNTVTAIFLDTPPAPGLLDAVTGQADEELAFGARELYVHYPSGMGRSKLAIKGAEAGTARNMNTVAKLAAMAAEA